MLFRFRVRMMIFRSGRGSSGRGNKTLATCIKIRQQFYVLYLVSYQGTLEVNSIRLPRLQISITCVITLQKRDLKFLVLYHLMLRPYHSSFHSSLGISFE